MTHVSMVPKLMGLTVKTSVFIKSNVAKQKCDLQNRKKAAKLHHATVNTGYSPIRTMIYPPNLAKRLYLLYFFQLLA